jgi:hypothetical protein
MSNNYEMLYRKYKNKYLKLSNKIKGGALSVDMEVNKTYQIKRPYNGETTLILGCGNGPDLIVDEAYKNEHLHQGVYTIDILEQMNPSCLTDMSKGTFCDIPDNTIEQIICEGFVMDILTSGKFISEINRIKKKGGICECEFKNIGTFRNFGGNWDNIYDDPVFINYQEALIFSANDRKDFELGENGNMKVYIKDNTGAYISVDYMRLWE